MVMAMRNFTAYAAPMSYGPKITIASHIGKMSYTIGYSAVGDAIVLGRVHYYKQGGDDKVTESLADGATIHTSDVVANIEIDFQGAASGSSITGTISP